MKFLILFFTVTVGLLQSSVAVAAEGLVTCVGGDDCNFCSFVDMANGLIEWLIIIATLLTVLLLAFSGFRLLTSGGDAAALEQAKKIFVSSIIGIMIMLAGWTVVDTALKVAAGGDLGVWNAIECGGAFEVTPADGVNIVLEEHEGVTFRSMEVDDLFTNEGNAHYQTGVGSFGGNIPMELAGSLPAQPAGQLCFANGVCVPAVNVSGQSGYEYPLCGFDINQFVDLNSVNLNTKVSKYFTLGEVIAPKNKANYGRYAYVDPQLPIILDALRERIGSFTITSGYRSPGYNRALGTSNSGVASCSRHLSGLAVDIIPPSGWTQGQVANVCLGLQARFAKSDYRVHVHCDWGHLTGRTVNLQSTTGPL